MYLLRSPSDDGNDEASNSPTSSSSSRRTKAWPTEIVPITEPPQAEPDRAEGTAFPPALNPKVAAGDAPTVSETEAPAPTEAPVEAAATMPAAESLALANKLSALDAAAKVLAETGQAMSCGKLITAMAAKGYWQSPRGRTSAGTLASALLRELQTKGDKTRFCTSERGKFRLNSAL
jgi:hypothetical protein